MIQRISTTNFGKRYNSNAPEIVRRDIAKGLIDSCLSAEQLTTKLKEAKNDRNLRHDVGYIAGIKDAIERRLQNPQRCSFSIPQGPFI